MSSRHAPMSASATAILAAVAILLGGVRIDGLEREEETVGQRLRRLQTVEAELARSVQQRTLALLDSEMAVARSALDIVNNVAELATGAPVAGGAAEGIGFAIANELGEAQEAKQRGDYDGAMASLKRIIDASIPIIVEEYAGEIPNLRDFLRRRARNLAQGLTVGEPLLTFADANGAMIQQYVNLKRTVAQHEKAKADLSLFVEAPRPRASRRQEEKLDPPPPPRPPKWYEELDGTIRIMELVDLASMNGLDSASPQYRQAPTELERLQGESADMERLQRAADQEERVERAERTAAARAAMAGQPFDKSLGALDLRALLPSDWVPCQCPPAHPGAGMLVDGVQYHTPLLHCP
jgi:hypothetical protein